MNYSELDLLDVFYWEAGSDEPSDLKLKLDDGYFYLENGIFYKTDDVDGDGVIKVGNLNFKSLLSDEKFEVLVKELLDESSFYW